MASTSYNVICCLVSKYTDVGSLRTVMSITVSWRICSILRNNAKNMKPKATPKTNCIHNTKEHIHYPYLLGLATTVPPCDRTSSVRCCTVNPLLLLPPTHVERALSTQNSSPAQRVPNTTTGTSSTPREDHNCTQQIVQIGVDANVVWNLFVFRAIIRTRRYSRLMSTMWWSTQRRRVDVERWTQVGGVSAAATMSSALPHPDPNAPDDVWSVCARCDCRSLSEKDVDQHPDQNNLMRLCDTYRIFKEYGQLDKNTDQSQRNARSHAKSFTVEIV